MCFGLVGKLRLEPKGLVEACHRYLPETVHKGLIFVTEDEQAITNMALSSRSTQFLLSCHRMVPQAFLLQMINSFSLPIDWWMICHENFKSVPIILNKAAKTRPRNFRSLSLTIVDLLKCFTTCLNFL